MEDRESRDQLISSLRLNNRQDLIERLNKNDWTAFLEIKNVHTTSIMKVMEFPFEEADAFSEMAISTVLLNMGMYPTSPESAVKILESMREFASSSEEYKNDVEKINHIIDIPISDDNIVPLAMSSMMEIYMSDSPYSNIVNECGNYLLEICVFNDEEDVVFQHE